MARARGIVIAGNWKMNHGPRESAVFFQSLRAPWKKIDPVTAVRLDVGKLKAALFVPAVSLDKARLEADGLPIAVGAQNAHWEKKGAFTGELSGPLLSEIGIEWVLVGHSERRQYFGETSETVGKRAQSLLAQNFTVMACIGETRAEREAGRTREVLESQLEGLFAPEGVASHLGGKLIIAYEPVWAIGTGLTATPEQAEEAHAMVRGWIERRLGHGAAQEAQILYGGSVTPENLAGLLDRPGIDGALVGGASLKPESFLSLVSIGGKALSG